MGVRGMTPWKCDDRQGSETSEASGDVVAKQRQSQFHNAHQPEQVGGQVQRDLDQYLRIGWSLENDESK